MKAIRQCVLVALILSSFSVAVAQEGKGLQEWLRIKLFKSTRSDVERLYGSSSDNPVHHFVRYKNSRGSIYVAYSKGGCEAAESPMWDVPEWTVIEVGYTPTKNPPALTELLVNRKRFKVRQAGDVIGHVEYYDEEHGISIVYDKDEREVRNITIKPTLKDQQRYDCSVKTNTKYRPRN
jgi:hypothetical protein